MTSGDGWTSCSQGHRHWGLFGAAGLMLCRDGEVLLQLRSPTVHRGGTWSIPGGARNADEAAPTAALREAYEEMGLPAGDVEILAPSFTDDHGGWSYTTVLGRLRSSRSPELRNNHESKETRWVRSDDVQTLPLHPGFAASWPAVLTVVNMSSSW
ncbi:8-oxo-dGTP pyrophosphatase MutT (NUDIX family) [Nakamurella sp. UYEF19]|uniref:NUDIX hydrolase n=1 Tax=Nakamurella sp. UYEF19 TaxID=1756392 RepID=UPI003391C366